MSDFNVGIYQPMFEKVATKVDSIEVESKRHKSVAKINLYFRNPQDRLAAYEELKDLPLEFVYAEATSLEMTAKNVSKATGLMELAQKLGILMNEVVGIGDADNDIEMFKSVGLAVAMKNGNDTVKKLAHFITNDNDNNGVGEAIQHILKDLM